MKRLGFIRGAFGVCAAAALLASCSTGFGTVPQANVSDAKTHSLDSAPLGRLAGLRHDERVLWSFTNVGKIGDGDPTSNLIFDNKGALYGTFTLSARFEDGGGVFKLTPSGSKYSESLLHGFQGGNDGANPAAGLIFDKRGALYSTTAVGGAGCNFGCGTVFKLKPSVSGYSESVVYRFAGAPDGANPYAGLIFDEKGALYGTTSGGGDRGYGTVFKLTPLAFGYSESVLYSFHGGSDGAHPYASLIFDKKGALYGTTAGGGHNSFGTAFKLTPSKSGYSESIIYRFQGGGDGANPYAALVFGKKGVLYGTTAAGGYYGFGTVFTLTPLGSSQYYENLLLSFGGRNDGAHSNAGLLFGKKGELYGTTSGGGRYGFGTAFKLTPSGSGYSRRYSESILHHFNFDNGASPEAGLTFGATGALYGTTSAGGDHGYNGFGTVFELAP
jgi:uncharacterized repeat protein (TIGR03803 family)